MEDSPATVRPSSDLSGQVETLAGKVDDLSAQVGICIALAEVTAVRIARVSDEKEIREDEFRKLRRIVRARLTPPPNGNGHGPEPTQADYFRRELESLSDDIHDTKTKILEEQIATLKSAQGFQLQKWHAIPAIILAVATLLGTFFGGRGSAPLTPQPFPYPVTIPTGVHP